jgi:HD-GYP domain-containing protein (c-di-GMP phosphodiesterase class II)
LAELQKVRKGDITLGVPLLHSVYDKSGMLLLRAGFTINLPRHLDHLIESGLYMGHHEPVSSRVVQQTAEDEAQSAFEMLDMLKIKLKNIFGNYQNGKAQDAFVRQISGIALNLQEACTHDADAALANLHLDYEIPYIVVHSLQAAMICELVGKMLGIQDDKRLIVINAALTQGIGLLDLQDMLDHQNSPLTPEQKNSINVHPLKGAALLESLGVTDSIWLDAVRQHHERLDGSGYPNKLTGDSITIPARLLAVADTYSAMVRERPYRKAIISKEAMRSLLVEQGSKIDQRLIEMMIKVVGVFPPGAIVKLANGEVGVVKKRQKNSTYPIVFAFIRPDGMPKLSPVQRDTENAKFGVVGIVNFSNYRGCMAMLRGLWINS